MSDLSPKNTVKRVRSSKARSLVGILIALGIAAGMLVAASMVPSQKRDVAPTEAPPVNVRVLPVTAIAQLPDTFDLPAVVEPNRIVTVAAEVAGRIETIPPREGGLVQAGDVLVQLNTDLIKPQVQVAEAQFKRDKIQYERMAALVASNATSRSDLDDAINRLAISEAQLAENRARLERCRIVAPIRGILNDLPVEEGEYVQAGTAVAELVETDTVKVAVDVPERDIGFFSVGQKAQVPMDAPDGPESVEGTITFISKIASPLTRSTRMEVTLDNTQGLLRSGQIVRVRLTRRVLEDAILIPLLAVIPMEDGKAVYVVDSNQQAERRTVTLGIIKGDQVRITKGLFPGDRLIVAGHRFVAPGQAVKVIEDQTESEKSL
jgi:membrane fusion protein (multidrug efflux system)